MSRSLGLGGSERQLAEIAKNLDRSRFEPHVACFHAEGFRAEELRAAGVPVVQFDVSSFVGPSVVSGAMAAGRYLRDHAIQLVHTFDVPLNLFGVPVARLFRTPRVISSQRAHRALTPGLRRQALRITDHMVDAVVVNSDAVRRELVVQDRVPPQMVHLCYNGLDTDRFPLIERSSKGPVVIGTIGALRAEKGLDALLEAFARLTHHDVRLVIVGSGPAESSLRRLASSLNLGERCSFEPATSDVGRQLADIDIFVLPSLSESFSNSLMEAMACGCCAVASRTGGNPELVAEASTGLLFHPGDSSDLARCLEMLLTDAALRARLADSGERTVRTEFPIARVAARMAEIYQAVLN
jgi:glycosyltransferase involved in cell wall biosynthesis